MRIFQVIENLVYGDAISNYCRNIYKLLKENGYETAIFAVHYDKRLDDEKVLSIDDLPELLKDDLMIYQMCQKSMINKMITNWKCKKACIYHNVTPAHFFFPYDVFQSAFQKRGLREINKLNKSFDYIWGDSFFNCQDLISMGYDKNKVAVSPIIIDFDDFLQEPDEKIRKKYSDEWVNILFVGRVAPNKKHEDIIRIFTYYKKYVNQKSRLILIGSFFNAAYQNCLERYVEELDVKDVIFPGHISFKEILGFYKTANVFLCMSEHEGFCVPLLEAMLFDIPIIAYDCTAVPETLGESGILVQEKNPAQVSFMIDQVINNAELQREIIEKQRKRLDDFAFEKVGREFLKQIEQISLE